VIRNAKAGREEFAVGKNKILRAKMAGCELNIAGKTNKSITTEVTENKVKFITTRD
jgi:hypothetical protein